MCEIGPMVIETIVSNSPLFLHSKTWVLKHAGGFCGFVYDSVAIHDGVPMVTVSSGADPTKGSVVMAAGPTAKSAKNTLGFLMITGADGKPGDVERQRQRQRPKTKCRKIERSGGLCPRCTYRAGKGRMSAILVLQWNQSPQRSTRPLAIASTVSRGAIKRFRYQGPGSMNPGPC